MTNDQNHLEQLLELHTRQLIVTNQQLQQEIAKRKEAEEALRKLNAELGITVAERTIYLGSAIEQLQQEMVKRKQTEEALRESEERFRAIFEQAAIGMDICDLEGRFVQVNQKLCDILGYSQSELKALTFIELTHPDDQQTNTEYLRSLLANEISTFSLKKRYIHKQGHTIWANTTISLLYDSSGKPKYYIGVIEDISSAHEQAVQRQQMEQKLEASQQKYKTLFEILPIGVSITDEVGNIIEANPALEEILGISEPKSNQEIYDVTPWSIIQADGTPIPVSEIPCIRALRENKTIKNLEMGVVKSKEETTWLNVTAAPIPLKNYGVAIAYVDITERKKVERMKDEFLAITSHELRTPLTSLRGSLGLLKTGRLGNLTEKGQKLLEFALLDTERLVRLVKDILDLKQLKFGKNVITRRICQMADLIEQVSHVMQPIADEAEVKLSIASISTPVWADRDRIIQVLTNLLSNAIKFSPPGSTVSLSAEFGELGRRGDAGMRGRRDKERIPDSEATKDKQQFPTILFQVKDQGRGISSDQLETIFEPFRQADSSDSHQKEGTGLGLAICRSIVQQHGGHIWVESTSGVGSTFYFTLGTLPEKTL